MATPPCTAASPGKKTCRADRTRQSVWSFPSFVNLQGDLFVKNHTLGILTGFGLALSGIAHAQSSVTLYGIIDEAVRYDTHQNKSGGHLFTMGSGGEIQGSRWGLQGYEDLGGGLQAIFQLENGFSAVTGAGNYQRAHGRLVTDIPQHLSQFFNHPYIERVERLGTIDGHRRDRCLGAGLPDADANDGGAAAAAPASQ